MTDKRDERETKRPERKPMYIRKVLTGDIPDGFVGRWVNEAPGAVERYLQAGYHIVLENGDISENRIQDASQLGSVQRRVVNQNLDAISKTAILMAIKQEWYDEDQAAKSAALDEKEKSLDAENRRDSDYGSIKKSRS